MTFPLRPDSQAGASHRYWGRAYEAEPVTSARVLWWKDAWDTEGTWWQELGGWGGAHEQEGVYSWGVGQRIQGSPATGSSLAFTQAAVGSHQRETNPAPAPHHLPDDRPSLRLFQAQRMSQKSG